MQGFKSFITEAKKPKTFRDYLEPIPDHELLDHHLDFANHGIKLPDVDTNTLMKHMHNDRVVIQHLPNGGHVTFTKDHYEPGAYYENANGHPHRTDGPSQINAATGEHNWHLNGTKVAHWKETTIGFEGYVRDNTHGYGTQGKYFYKGKTLDQTPLFNEALKKHGFPAFTPPTQNTIAEAYGEMVSNPMNVNHTHARSKLHTVEKPFNPFDLIELHMQARDNDIEIPDEPMKYGDIYHHHVTKAHSDVFFTDHTDVSKLPHFAQTAIIPKLNAGYQIHSMAHVYGPWGGITYAHMSRPELGSGHLYQFLHESE